MLKLLDGNVQGKKKAGHPPALGWYEVLYAAPQPLPCSSALRLIRCSISVALVAIRGTTFLRQ
jgi:hypothetical protein